MCKDVLSDVKVHEHLEHGDGLGPGNPKDWAGGVPPHPPPLLLPCLPWERQEGLAPKQQASRRKADSPESAQALPIPVILSSIIPVWG